MTVQILPQPLFEQEVKTIVLLEKDLESNDNLNEKMEHDQNDVTLYYSEVASIAPILSTALYSHSSPLNSSKEDIFTPPPNFC
jgi:hypothetical protein